MVNISFPGIGIDTFSVSKTAFTIPIGNGISVRWYGVIITLGIILAICYCAYRAKDAGIIFDDLLDMAIFTVIFAILGARLYYVIFSGETYGSLLDVIAIWNGGLAIYGAIIAGAVTIYFVCKHKKISFPKALDMVAPAVMIGQILGRWGNFFNGEAHGTEVLSSEFLYFMRMGLSFGENRPIYNYYHPTFLYESIWNLVGFIIINSLYKKKKFDGQIVLMYFTWYGFGRMFIEGLRTDSLMLGVFRISQVIGFVCFAAGAVLLIIGFNKARRIALATESYETIYSSVSDTESAESSTEPTEAAPKLEDDKKREISDKLKNLFADDTDKEEK